MNLRSYAPALVAAFIISSPAWAQSSPPPPVAETETPSHAETEFWSWAKNSRNPDDFAGYLRKYPNGAYAAEAKARIAALKADREVITQGPDAGAVPAPPPGKGQIVFFRPNRYVGLAEWFKVRESGVELGKLANGAFFICVLDPGKHTFTAATENQDRLILELDDGETLYVKGGLSMGVVMGEARLTPSDAAAFHAALDHMHQVEALTPSTRTPPPPAQ